MEDTSGNKDKQICLGLVAHVDSGKTTLAESILYQSGQIRTLGRVDHKDAFLDTYELESTGSSIGTCASGSIPSPSPDQLESSPATAQTIPAEASSTV